MPIEIERRFLVCSDEWRAAATSSCWYRQCYLSRTPKSSIRVRQSEKVRHWVEHAGMTWEVDDYCGEAAVLALAEVEPDCTDQPLALPQWVGAEVTSDLRYRSLEIARGLRRDVDGRPSPPPLA
jgi:CYTH domain-containing protein